MLKDILLEKELFIFDMDGTITDTEPLHFLSYQRTLAELFPGFVLTEEEFLSCYVGHPETEIYALLQKAHGIVFADDVFFQKQMCIRDSNKPPLSPPGWLFPVVWTILYILMGIASYLVLTSGKPNQTALTIYGVQLFFNFFWSILFFNMQSYLFAFIWLVILWLLIFATSILFHQISKLSGYLILPYLLWVTFAGYWNFSIYLLN